MNAFEDAYKRLNTAQKQAVDTLDGPVMVIAGPGTGKTQVLALRIAHILKETDTAPSSILCLTFTRAGVSAMRNRLAHIVGPRAREVRITTFHSFAHELIQKYFSILDYTHPPELITEAQAVMLIDTLLHSTEWQYLRPRSNPTLYFNDLRSLISLLKRERMTADNFLVEIKSEIHALQTDPASLSSRGETKGQLKKDIQKKIEGLERTFEVVLFYEKYEALKKERNVVDYDDVLEGAVAIAEQGEEAQADIREQYQYVLVDEHQDSSGVQNSFLRAVWADVERPDIFVVGDDRQLIYGFGGASLSYFEDFKTAFGEATCITLTENYRSTKTILGLADALLASVFAQGKLVSNSNLDGPVERAQFQTTQDEILGAGLHFKALIARGVAPESCALLVPKNHLVRSAIATLRSLGLPVVSETNVSLFALPETQMFLRVVRIVANPYDSQSIARSLFDSISEIPAVDAHHFLHETDSRTLSLDTLRARATNGLFADPIAHWAKQIDEIIEQTKSVQLREVLLLIGNSLFITKTKQHDELIARVEIVRTLLSLAEARTEHNPHETLSEFLEYIARLETYNQHVGVSLLAPQQGITVKTLHGSKGLEYEHVWIAHMNQEILMAQKRLGFTIPEAVSARIEERDQAVATREVYVAITRAKEACTISYAKERNGGGELTLVHSIADAPQEYFKEITLEETTKKLSEHPTLLTSHTPVAVDTISFVTNLVSEHYSDRKVSVTLLNNFFECPWRWYFRNFLQLPEQKSDSLAFGTAVHAGLECVLTQKNAMSEVVLETILRALQKEGIETKKQQTLAQKAHTLVLAWRDTHITQLLPQYESERSVSYRDPLYPNLTLYGKIDLTEREPNGDVIVTDFKTGSEKTAATIEKRNEEGRLSGYLRQLAMYRYLIEGAEKTTHVRSSKLYYLEAKQGSKDQCYSAHITDEVVDLLKRDIAEYVQFLSTGTWRMRPCHAVSFGGGTCEHCALARTLGLIA